MNSSNNIHVQCTGSDNLRQPKFTSRGSLNTFSEHKPQFVRKYQLDWQKHLVSDKIEMPDLSLQLKAIAVNENTE